MKGIAQWRRPLSLAVVLLVVAGCERAPVAPVVPPIAADDVSDSWWLLGTLLKCSPLPYDSTTAVIGADGGLLAVGPHTFTVPAGALDTATVITAVVDPDSVNQVRFSPQGLVFQQPASLTMSYANCGLFGLFIPKRIAYVTDDFRILQLIPSLDDVLHRQVTGQVSHFSQYAIAW
jgi:hypothetical protein